MSNMGDFLRKKTELPVETGDDIKELREEFDGMMHSFADFQRQQPKVCLMSPATAMLLIGRGDVSKEMTLGGVAVIEDDRIEDGKILVLNEDEYASWFTVHGETQPQEERKKPERIFHCRVCGTGYQSKQEAKECVRTHDWQNRRGRR